MPVQVVSKGDHISHFSQLVVRSGTGDMMIRIGGMVENAVDCNELIVNVADKPHAVGDMEPVDGSPEGIREATQSAVLRYQFGSLESLEVFIGRAVELWRVMAAKRALSTEYPEEMTGLILALLAPDMADALLLRDEFERHVFAEHAMPRSQCPVCDDLEKREQAAREAIVAKLTGKGGTEDGKGEAE